MANPKHAAKLMEGVETWNAWKSKHSGARVDLSGANLRGALLRRADLRGANLWHAKLVGADLSGAELDSTNLDSADLCGADLRRAALRRATLRMTNLAGADLTDATVSYTVFADTDLSKVKGLEALRHDFPSTIGLDTIYLSQGEIPESFLRGCGVPD